MNYPVPEMLIKGNDVGITMAGVTVWLSDIENSPPTRAEILGRPLQRVALYILTKACFLFKKKHWFMDLSTDVNSVRQMELN